MLKIHSYHLLVIEATVREIISILSSMVIELTNQNVIFHVYVSKSNLNY